MCWCFYCHWRADIGRLFVDSKLSLPGSAWDGVALALANRALPGVLLHPALALLLRWPRRASALRVRVISSASYTACLPPHALTNAAAAFGSSLPRAAAERKPSTAATFAATFAASLVGLGGGFRCAASGRSPGMPSALSSSRVPIPRSCRYAAAVRMAAAAAGPTPLWETSRVARKLSRAM